MLATVPPGSPERHEKLETWCRSKDRSRLLLLFDLLLHGYRDLLRSRVQADASGSSADPLQADETAWASRLGPRGIAECIRKVEEARETVEGYGYVPLVLYSLFEQMPSGSYT